MKKITKRIPFGFSGDWASLYTLHYGDVIDPASDFETVIWQKKVYAKHPQQVQIVKGSDLTSANAIHSGVILDESNLTVTTTDAYFCPKTKAYKCIVQNGDILKLYNVLWICNTITSQVILRTPKEQIIYSIELVQII